MTDADMLSPTHENYDPTAEQETWDDKDKLPPDTALGILVQAAKLLEIYNAKTMAARTLGQDIDDLNTLRHIRDVVDTCMGRLVDLTAEGLQALRIEIGPTKARSKGPKAARKTGPLPPMYQHPEDPSKTWAGRGKTPGWMKTFLDAGWSKEQMKIQAELQPST